MKVPAGFDFDLDDLSIPDGFVRKLQKHWSGIQPTVQIDRKTGPTGWKKVGIFEIPMGATNEPEVEDEDVARYVIAFAQHDMESYGDRARYRGVWKQKIEDRTARRQYSFDKGPDETDTQRAYDQSDPDFQSHINSYVQMVTEGQRVQAEHLDKVYGRVIALCENSTKQSDNLLKTIEKQGQMAYEGLKARDDAMQYITKMEREKMESERTNAMFGEAMGLAKQILPIAMLQLSASLNKKGFKVPMPNGVSPDDVRSAHKPSNPPRESADATGGVEDPSEEQEAEGMENPLTSLAGTIRDSLRADQWMELPSAGPKIIFILLKEAFNGETDDVVAGAVYRLREELQKRPSAKSALMDILDNDQKLMIVHLLMCTGPPDNAPDDSDESDD